MLVAPLLILRNATNWASLWLVFYLWSLRAKPKVTDSSSTLFTFLLEKCERTQVSLLWIITHATTGVLYFAWQLWLADFTSRGVLVTRLLEKSCLCFLHFSAWLTGSIDGSDAASRLCCTHGRRDLRAGFGAEVDPGIELEGGSGEINYGEGGRRPCLRPVDMAAWQICPRRAIISRMMDCVCPPF